MKVIYVFAICLSVSLTTAAPTREFFHAVGNKINETANVVASEVYGWLALGNKLVFGKPEVTTVSPAISQESLYKLTKATNEMVDKLNNDNESIKKNLAMIVEQQAGVGNDPDRTEIGLDLRKLLELIAPVQRSDSQRILIDGRHRQPQRPQRQFCSHYQCPISHAAVGTSLEICKSCPDIGSLRRLLDRAEISDANRITSDN
ncbi:hypothetical protein RR46_04095 [Papilio xuthus]|uniref:Uncharacterized protein n=1 Tax=Papilio xuthus TaxID=66420 RepID=A0A194QHV8_PAPXU|nr:hypothetical protein RR46_04095 [Papilio xuthus]